MASTQVVPNPALPTPPGAVPAGGGQYWYWDADPHGTTRPVPAPPRRCGWGMFIDWAVYKWVVPDPRRPNGRRGVPPAAVPASLREVARTHPELYGRLAAHLGVTTAAGRVELRKGGGGILVLHAGDGAVPVRVEPPWVVWTAQDGNGNYLYAEREL